MNKTILKSGLIALVMMMASSAFAVEKVATVRRVGDVLIANVNDQETYGIVCDKGSTKAMIVGTSAYLVLPNSKGDINTDISGNVQMSAGASPRSPRLPFVDKDIDAACKLESGTNITLSVNKEGVELKGVRSVSAQSHP